MKLKTMLYRITASSIVSTLLTTSVSATNNEQTRVKAHQSPMPFVVTKGKSYALCNDVATYINEHRAFYDNNPRELFSIKTGKFNKPKMKPSTFERYVKIRLQDISYNNIHFSADDGIPWKELINSIEEIMEKNLKVTEFTIDINNDGVRDKVMSYSFYDEKYNEWVFINQVLDDKGNLNLAFKKGRSTFGELFYYDGRSFRYDYDVNQNSIDIYENFPMYESSDRKRIPENMIGLRDYPNICAVSEQKRLKNKQLIKEL